MNRIVVTGAVVLALAACADPESDDRRGYTKAPLEKPGLLVGGEDAGPMARINRPNLPRPPHRIDVEEPDAGAAAGEQEVTLAPGVTQEQFDEGRELFSGQGACQSCHGPGGQGTQIGPSLADAEWLHVSGPDVEELARVISTGVPDPREHPAPMPPMGGANLTEQQVRALAGYVASIGQD